MNRNDLQALGRLIIVGIAAYILFSQFTVLFYLPLLFLSDLKSASVFQLSVSSLALAALLVAVWLLLRRSDRISQWLMRPAPAETDSVPAHEPCFWLPAAFRVVCVLGGIACLLRLIGRAVPMICYLVGKRSFQGQWHLFAGWLLMLAVGAYLLYGAPRFVRWHVKKTLELYAEGQDKTPEA